MSAPRLKPFAAAGLAPEQKQLYDAILNGRRATGHVGVPLTQEAGALVGPFNAMLLSPQLGEAMQQLGEHVRFCTNVTKQQLEIAILSVAAHTGSTFEWYAHEAIARIIGMDEATIASLKAGRKPAGLKPEEGAAYDIAAELLSKDRLDDDTYRSVVAILGERGVFEVAVVVGYYRLVAGVLGTFAIEAPATARQESVT